MSTKIFAFNAAALYLFMYHVAATVGYYLKNHEIIKNLSLCSV